ncbi:MAG: cadherin repeat domain-containing protein [Mogibacterium sp.]|nr:cadherin repeat domain-containing protein [Mogibacterium sp.]
MKTTAKRCRAAAANTIITIMLCMTLVCSPVWAGLPGALTAHAASDTCVELEGTNSGANNYTVAASPIYSYLTVSGSGYMRVQGYGSGSFYNTVYNPSVTDGSFDVIYYDSDFNITSNKHIDAELKLFGGFYESDNNFYIVSGQENPEENENVEVFRITKYDKKWNRLGSCGLYGANTTIPFDAGSCRIDGSGNRLAIRTSHEMYMSEDGLNHQASVLMIVDTDAMKVLRAQYTVSSEGSAYVSHSFNQFIKIGDGETAMLDHGDAYPRSIALLRFSNDLSEGTIWGYLKQSGNVMNFPGETGDNATGASVGGFEITSSGYLIAGNAIYQHCSTLNDSMPRDVFVTAIDTSGSTVTSSGPIWLTDVGSKDNASTPQLVKISDNKFMVLWRLSKEVQYVLVDGDGNKLSETYSLNGTLSDCHPIVRDGKVIWYKWNNDEEVFYVIPVDSPDKVQIINRHCGHSWESVSASNGTAKVKCSKCGETRTVSYPEDFMLGYSTDTSSYSYGYQRAEVSLTDTVYIRGCYHNYDSGEYTTFSELNLEADSSKVVIDKVDNTLTFTDEGTYTITGRHKFDNNATATMTLVVEDPAHVWEVESAKDGVVTYRCSHCGKTKQGGYPSSFDLGYSPDGYSFYYSRKQVTVDLGATLYFDGMYYDDEYQHHTFSDLVLETSDPEKAVVEDGLGVHFTEEGEYTVTARYKYDPSVYCTIKVYSVGSGHEWEFQSAEDGIATFVCTDCGMIKTEEYPRHLLAGFKVNDNAGSCSSFRYNEGMVIIDIADTVTMGVYGYNDLSNFTIETDRPDDSVIDSETGIISFKESGWHEITVRHKYDPSSKDTITFIVNKDLESVELTANPANSCPLGTTVRLDAEENGGWGYEVFTYTLTDPDGNTSELYVANMDDMDHRYFDWTPDRRGTYKIHVSVYDKKHKPEIVVEDDMTYEVTAKVHETMPAEQYSIPNSATSFGNELLEKAPGWEFDAEELAILGHDIEVGEPVTITARYTADDFDDYDVNEMTVTVTRSSCNHDKTELVGAKAATCCEEGFSGDEVCTKCGEVVKAGVVTPVDASNHTGILENAAEPASWYRDGMTASKECTACGAVISSGEVIPAIESVYVEWPENNKYTGKAKTADIEVYDRNYELLTEGRDYLVTYEDNVDPGYAYVYIDFIGNYEGDDYDWFEIVKGDNTLKAVGKTATVKYSNLKKRSQTLLRTKIIGLTNLGKGTKTYTVTSALKSGKSYKKYFTINKTSGKLTVKKGLKKGTYKVKVKVTASGNSYYKSKSQTVTVTIKVK